MDNFVQVQTSHNSSEVLVHDTLHSPFLTFHPARRSAAPHDASYGSKVQDEVEGKSKIASLNSRTYQADPVRYRSSKFHPLHIDRSSLDIESIIFRSQNR